MNWFYESGGQQQGPISEAELDRLIGEGKIKPQTLVWREGLPDWQPLSQARPVIDPNSAHCASCGNVFPTADLIDIGGRPICATCKPAVLQELQQGGGLVGLDEAARTSPPWERRAELGTFSAAWSTLQEVLVKPGETFTAMRREGGLLTPFLYALLMGSIGGIAYALYQFALHSMTPAFRQELPPGMPEEIRRWYDLMQSPYFFLGYAIFVPVIVSLSTFIGAGILHLCLMLCGGANQPFETTYRVYCYSYGSAMALQVIPFCGAGVAGIWNLVCTCIGLAKAHETETWRSVLAVLLPMIVCCVGVIGLVSIGIAAASANH